MAYAIHARGLLEEEHVAVKKAWGVMMWRDALLRAAHLVDSVADADMWVLFIMRIVYGRNDATPRGVDTERWYKRLAMSEIFAGWCAAQRMSQRHTPYIE